MHGTHTSHPSLGGSLSARSPFDPAEQIVPLLSRQAVWIDPPEELRDEVVDSVAQQLY